jgi:F0F1-type ATP synthase membrane subunit a
MATTTTITTRIWSAALTENYPLMILVLAFFTTYGAFATYPSLKQPDRWKGVASLIATIVLGVASTQTGPEAPYFYLAGVILAGVIWYVIDRVKQEPKTRQAQPSTESEKTTESSSTQYNSKG